MKELRVNETSLPGVLCIEPGLFSDDRGYFLETYHLAKYTGAGLAKTFVQDNHSFSIQGVMRGLHYQLHHPQGKLVFVVAGEVFDVAVDIRRGSPSFGRWVGKVLSAENRCQMYIPEGFAHGFCVLSRTAYFMYKCTDHYDAQDDRGILWSDESLGIDWPVQNPVVSAKDMGLPALASIPQEELPLYA